MNRRSILLLGVAKGGALTLAQVTGAFDAFRGSREVEVTVTDDSNAYLGLRPHDGPNGAYARTQSGGVLTLAFDDEIDGVDGHGVNPDAVTTAENVFIITNDGTEPVDVSVTTDIDALEFYYLEEGEEVGFGSSPVDLDVGESVDVSVVIDTQSFDGEEIAGDVVVSAATEQVDDLPDGTDEVDHQRPTVDRTGSNAFAVTAPERTAETTTVAELPETELSETDDSAFLSTISIVVEDEVPIDITVEQLEGTDDLPDPDHVVVDSAFQIESTSPPNDAIDEVRFDLVVARDDVNDPGDVGLQRRVDGEWVPVPTEHVSSGPDEYYFQAVSPGFSQFALTIVNSDIFDRVYTRYNQLVMPDRTERTFRVESTTDDLELDATSEYARTVGDDIALDFEDRELDEEGTVFSDTFEITNQSDTSTVVRCTSAIDRVSMKLEGSSLFTFQSPAQLEPDESVTVSVEIEPPEPDNQLWISLNVLTTTWERSTRRYEEGDPKPGTEWLDEPVGQPVDCYNAENAPILVHQDSDSPSSGLLGRISSDPDWLPDDADSDHDYLQVPVILNLRHTGEWAEEIDVVLRAPEEDDVDGTLKSIYDPDDELGVGGDHIDPGVEVTVEADGGNVSKEFYYVFESDNRCDSDINEALLWDYIGDLGLDIRLDSDGQWQTIASGSTHEVRHPYYTQGPNLTGAAQNLLDDAAAVFAEGVAMAGHLGTAARMYRVARTGQLTRVDIWDTTVDIVDEIVDAPLTPQGVLTEAIVQGMTGFIGDNQESPSVFLEEFGDIDLYGPTFYVSDDIESSQFAVDIRSRTAAVGPGGTFETEVRVENVGDGAGTEDIALLVDDDIIDSRSATLDVGETETMTFEWDIGEREPGEYTVSVASGSDSETVAVEIYELDQEFDLVRYDLDECSGVDIADHGTPGEFDGTFIGSPTWVEHPDGDGCGVEIDGDAETYIEAPINSRAPPVLTFAVVCSFESGVSEQYHGTWGTELNGGDGRCYLGARNASTLQYGFGDEWNSISVDYETGQPVLLTITADPRDPPGSIDEETRYEVTFYYNEAELHTTTAQFSIDAWNNLWIGSNNPSGTDGATSGGFSGTVYEARIVSDTFDEDDITELYDERVGGQSAGSTTDQAQSMAGSNPNPVDATVLDLEDEYQSTDGS